MININARPICNVNGTGEVEWDRVLAWWYDPVIDPFIGIVVGNLDLAIEMAQKPGSQVAYRHWLDDPNVPGRGDEVPAEIYAYGLDRYIGDVADHAPNNVILHLGNELNPQDITHLEFLDDAMNRLASRPGWATRHTVFGRWGMGAFEDDNIWYDAPPTLPGGNHVDEQVRGVWLDHFVALALNPYWHTGYGDYYEFRPQVADPGYQFWLDGRPVRWWNNVRSALGDSNWQPPLCYVYECGPDSNNYSEAKGWRNVYIANRGRSEFDQGDVDAAAREFARDMLLMMRFWSEHDWYRGGAMFYWNTGRFIQGQPLDPENAHAAFELKFLPLAFYDELRAGILEDDGGGEEPPMANMYLSSVRQAVRTAPSLDARYFVEAFLPGMNENAFEWGSTNGTRHVFIKGVDQMPVHVQPDQYHVIGQDGNEYCRFVLMDGADVVYVARDIGDGRLLATIGDYDPGDPPDPPEPPDPPGDYVTRAEYDKLKLALHHTIEAVQGYAADVELAAQELFADLEDADPWGEDEA